MNIGLIGFGAMGRAHAYAVGSLPFYYKDSPDAKITAVCAAHPEKAAEAARIIGSHCRVSDEDEMISDPDIDIIDVCTPNYLHFETVKKALDAGKHVLCEKPFCVSYEEAEILCKLASEKGVCAQVVSNNRFLAPLMRAKQLIEDDRLGRILTFRAAYLQSSALDLSRNYNWKAQKSSGAGSLYDLGPHIIDLAVWLCGKLKSVCGRAQTGFRERTYPDGKVRPVEVDEAFYIISELECGAVGTLETSKLCTGTNDDLTLEIYGTKGALKFSLMEPNWLYFYDIAESGGQLGGERGFKAIECVGRYPAPGGIFPGVKASVGWLRGHIGGMYAFLDCVRRGETPSPSFAEGAYVTRVIDRAYESARTGRTLAV